MNDCILVFDFGTTALKTALIDADFRIAAVESYDFNYDVPAPGCMECSVELYRRAMRETVRTIIPNHSVRRIAVTGQAETLIFVDGTGEAIAPAIVWLDDRAKKEAETLSEALDSRRFFAVTGNPAVDPVMPLCKLPWVRKNLPELDGKYEKALLLHDWVIHELTGEPFAEHGILSCSGYFDINRKAYDSDLLSAAGIDEKRLAEPAEPFAEVGTLSESSARLLGLPAGTPVSSGTLDQCASALGAGNITAGRVTETTGTVLAIAATLDRFEPDRLSVPVLCHGIRNRFLALPYAPAAGGALKQFRNQFLPEMTFSKIDEAAQKRPESNLLCLPHFCGKVSPAFRSEATGVFYGITLDTSPVDMARAIMEGVAFLLKENVEALKNCGCSANELLSFGGGAASAFWTQLKADALGLPVKAADVHESTALGCALGTALYAGELTERDIAEREIPGKRFLPDDNTSAILKKYENYLEVSRKLGIL